MGVNSGVGVVIRDEFGEVIVALCKSLSSQFPVAWTKLYALKQDILLA